jgi:rubredoxin
VEGYEMKHEVKWDCDLCGYNLNPQEAECCDMCGFVAEQDMPIAQYLNQLGIKQKEEQL